jgi:hypothetical protein
MLRFLFGKRSALTGHDLQLFKLAFWIHGFFPVIAQPNLLVINANLQSVRLLDTCVSMFRNIAAPPNETLLIQSPAPAH